MEPQIFEVRAGAERTAFNRPPQPAATARVMRGVDAVRNRIEENIGLA